MAEKVTGEFCRAVARDVARLAAEKYVYPEMGREIAGEIQAKLEGGGYDEIGGASELAMALTDDLWAVSKDRHWNVIYDPQRAAEYVEPETEEDAAQRARWLAQARRRNFGFARVELLNGNVGYIDLRELAMSEYAGETAVAAMAFVANCDALIFDLRQNHGGYPSMVQLLTSYLVEPEPQHINTFYYRPTGEYQQFWTFPHVPGRRLPDVPVYVLTSQATGSAPEEFAYNLKQMGRATLVGETTIGAAHPVTVEIVQGCFQVRLPYGRPINPITQENWEGCGVEPHIAVPQGEALRTAHLHALETLAKGIRDEEQTRALAWEMDMVRSKYTPVTVTEAGLSRYAGQYGQRTFAVEDGALTYMHQAHPVSWKLVPMDQDRFRLDEDMQFAFLADEQGETSAVVISYRDGRPEIRVDRTA
jgi:hypothetical protein